MWVSTTWLRRAPRPDSKLEHPIDVPLRVHNHRFAAREDRVAPIAQLWGLDGEDLRGHV